MSVGGWIYFTADGSLVLGLTEREPRARPQLERLVAAVGQGYGYIAGDAPPSDTRESFIQACLGGHTHFTVRP